jgi:hypothetical protein
VHHIGEKDPVRAAGDGFANPAFHDRERVGEHRRRDGARTHRHAVELVVARGPCESFGDPRLPIVEHVHREAACREHRLLGATVHVQTDQWHGRLQRERGDRADRHALVAVVVPRGEHHTPLVTVPMTVRNTALSNDDGVGASLTAVIAPPIAD